MLSQNKENYPNLLTKQGVVYEVKLGKNNGPFLSKDIMHDNPRSVNLLRGGQTLKSHKTMSNMMKLFTTTQAKIKSNVTLPQIENFSSNIKFLEGELIVLNKTSDVLKISQRKLRKEMQQLQQVVTKQTTQLYQQSIPLLKLLTKKIKEKRASENAQTYRLFRQLDSIRNQRKGVVEALITCTDKVLKLQQMFGKFKSDQIVEENQSNDSQNE